ncbi:hypothetical protein CHARACLAT_031357 [Characodon lateralis]|uniref:Uncharacterized protein n=1 Tax=Characodon lateralis TaxID=208331 RepID=A0ABU7E709_9TELE|nr:hypothetical protein [Characodon lateralis]
MSFSDVYLVVCFGSLLYDKITKRWLDVLQDFLLESRIPEFKTIKLPPPRLTVGGCSDDIFFKCCVSFKLDVKPLNGSIFDSSVQKTLPQQSWGSSRRFLANVRRSFCVIFVLQWF